MAPPRIVDTGAILAHAARRAQIGRLPARPQTAPGAAMRQPGGWATMRAANAGGYPASSRKKNLRTMNRIRPCFAFLAAVCAVALLAACARNAPPPAAPATEPPAAPTSASAAPAAATVAATAATAAATAITSAATPQEAAEASPTVAAGTQGGLAGRRATPGAPAGIALPTVTPKPAGQRALLPAPTPTKTPDPAPAARIVTALNVRSGPSTAYPVVGGLAAGSAVPIVGKNAAADWWQVTLPDATTGWLYAPLVEAAGNLAAVALAANIPAPPTLPPPTAAPTDAPAAPVAQATATPPAAPEPAAPAGGPDFRVVGKRLWDVYENGGFLVGDSVHCGEKRQLVVNVLDANGSRINGVAVQAEYGAREIIVTGSQGRGDGVAEFVLGGGQDVKVIRDNDGRAVTSEMATGLSTNPAAIPFEHLIAGQFCTDEASCRRFVDAPGCYGHYSWTVTFQRSR